MASLEKGITHIFSDADSIPLDVEDFKMKLVCCTLHGANVNFGEKTGLMTKQCTCVLPFTLILCVYSLE